MAVREIRTIGVVGAGIMGAGIAQRCAQGGYPVVFYNRSEAGLERGWRLIDGYQASLVTSGTLDRDAAREARERIQGTTDFAALEEVDFAFESIREDLDDKRELFGRLDALVSPDAILATNTSGLSITAIGDATRRRERVVGAHWWNPPHIVPLVEVVKGEHTRMETCEAARALLERLGKTPVLVLKDIPGFLANRIQVAAQREAVYLLERGAASAEDIDTAFKASFGLRSPVLGPLESMDYNGLDTCFWVHDYMGRDLFREPGAPAPLRKLAERGQLGLKTGRGFHDYAGADPEALRAARDRALLALLAVRRRAREEGEAPRTGGGE
jgi:3-hydroxyacyl-CoA dehydrogenase